MDISIEDNLNKVNNKINKDNIEQKLSEAYLKSEQISIIPLLKLIYKTTKIDLYKDFKLQYPLSSKKSDNIKTGEIIFKSNNKKFKIYLDIVDKNYDLLVSLKNLNIISNEIKDFNDTEYFDKDLKQKLIESISFLTQSCLVVFNNLKGKYKELIEYNLILDNNTTIYIDFNLNKRIGIVFKLL